MFHKYMFKVRKIVLASLNHFSAEGEKPLQGAVIELWLFLFISSQIYAFFLQELCQEKMSKVLKLDNVNIVITYLPM